MTGLRRKEIASLTPRNFRLDADPPTLTVEAACSKHRREDVLPMHPELVTLVREWIAPLRRTEPLFPKLAKRRTWLMVKKDLERVGIPYENDEGFADFHAAGRHSHITGLMRSGATLPEAQKLARHSDIKMTMKYTHIGIHDQAKAVGNLPVLHICCNPAGIEGLSVSPPVANEQPRNDATPGDSEGCDVACHPVSQGDTVEAAGIEDADHSGVNVKPQSSYNDDARRVAGDVHGLHFQRPEVRQLSPVVIRDKHYVDVPGRPAFRVFQPDFRQ